MNFETVQGANSSLPLLSISLDICTYSWRNMILSFFFHSIMNMMKMIELTTCWYK